MVYKQNSKESYSHYPKKFEPLQKSQYHNCRILYPYYLKKKSMINMTLNIQEPDRNMQTQNNTYSTSSINRKA